MLVKRESVAGSNDLQIIFRPCRIDEILGNTTNKNILRSNLDGNKVPHTMLFIGSSGCGKTTASRVVSLGLNCDNGITSNPCLKCDSCMATLNHNNVDVKEINVGQTGGKDAVEHIISRLSFAPFKSRFKILIFDEAHKLTDAAKDLLLKPIEDGYAHVYFIFCTNQPEKLMTKGKGDEKPFLNRCSSLSFERLESNIIKDLLINVSEFEGYNYNPDVIQYISESSKGIPRNALVWIKQINDEGSWEIDVAKELITGSIIDEYSPQIIELAKTLLKGQWQNSLKLYGKLNSLAPEKIRLSITGYFVGCLKRSQTVKEGRMYCSVLDVLINPIYDVGKSGEHKFYTYMFKVIDLINSSRGK